MVTPNPEAGRSERMRTGALGISLLLPGIGHIMLGWARGYVLLAGYGACVDLLLIGIALFRLDIAAALLLMLPGALGAMAIWVYCLINLVSSRPRGAVASQEDRDAHLRQGLIAYMRNDLKAARQELERVLAIEPGDLEARLQLCIVDRREGRLREARKNLLELRRMDRGRKLHWEISRELSMLE